MATWIQGVLCTECEQFAWLASRSAGL